MPFAVSKEILHTNDMSYSSSQLYVLASFQSLDGWVFYVLAKSVFQLSYMHQGRLLHGRVVRLWLHSLDGVTLQRAIASQLTNWQWDLSLYLSLSLCTLHRRRVVAPSLLTDPSQHSKHQKERALCSWWPAPPSILVDDLVVSSRCQTVLSPVVTWLRDVGLGGQEQPDPYAWHGQRESVSSDL